jgi:hypothetical protein
MFYTQLQLDCEHAIGVTTVCTVRDSYRIVYMLARGESLASMQTHESLSWDAVVMIVLFLLLAALFCVGLLLSLLVAAAHLDFEKLSMVYYWEPKLAAHFSLSDFGFPVDLSLDETTLGKFYPKLERIWDLFMISIIGGYSRKRKHWDVAGKTMPSALAVPFSLLAVVAVPLWLVLGLSLWDCSGRRRYAEPYFDLATLGNDRETTKTS